MSQNQKTHTGFARSPYRIGISMGCPVGIGPEIILRFLARRSLPEYSIPVVVGDLGVLQRCAAELHFDLQFTPWRPGQHTDPNKIYVAEPENDSGYVLKARSLQWGMPDSETGEASAAYIKTAVDLIKSGGLSALVTCPISKHAMQLAGYPFPGHTEMLASLCGTKNFGMMMAGSKLKISLVTIHEPLAKVAEKVNQPEIERIIKLTGETLYRDFDMLRPRIAVAGLNPHGGESGIFGREEAMFIEPAITRAGSEKWDLSGPLPPDTVFRLALEGRFDAVVAMYHDQGLIPFKLIHFADGVNLTMGLPLVRTSVDHGTAYDIAGKGIASESSLRAAFTLAGEIVSSRIKKAEHRYNFSRPGLA